MPLRALSSAVGFALIPGLLTPVAFAAEVEPLGKPKLKAPRSADVSPFTPKLDPRTSALISKAATAARADELRARVQQDKRVTWPKGGTAAITVPASGKVSTAVGSLPLTLAPSKPSKAKAASAPAGTVEINVLDQKRAAQLGVKGIVVTVTAPASAGKVELGIGYGAFGSAYGGDWAGRLQVVRLPGCALTEPADAKCRKRTPLEFTNDRAHERLNGQLAFTRPSAARASSPSTTQTMVLAVAAGTKSGSGDYKATPLASSSTWEAGGSSGTFTWTYPLRVPPSAAGPKPDLKISYDSGRVDGRTASTNNQGTAIGEGFDITSSYIERKYGSCDDDGQTDKYDLCWKYDNASLVLNGNATELVKDDTSGQWRLKNDDASTVKVSTGAENGDDNGEHWAITTGDGTTYHFGLNKLSGAGATDRTNSVWTVPVFGDDTGEPGYDKGTSFSARHADQAWRWNLDYVEDTRGNAMSYWYEAELNHYDMLGDDNNGTPYTRGGYLKEIRYGQRAGALFSAVPAASNRVVFGYAERCIVGDCGSLTDATRNNWPDVPFDAECKAGVKCTGNVGPSFYTRKRMTGVSTQAWDRAASTPGYASVDSWAFGQQFLDPGDTGDSHDQSLWLSDIRHTGKRGTDLSLAPVTFDHEFLPNRVDGATDDIISLDKPRLKVITSETGAQTIVTYMPADCIAGQTMPKVDQNNRRCYPVHWSPNGGKVPILDWFHKYPVQAVATLDPHGGSDAVHHTYAYSGPAWHYNEDPFVKEKERTWSQWRGFQKVTHLTGNAGSTQSKTVTVFMQGMNGDRVLDASGQLDKDARKTATVTGIKAPAITDADQYAGFTRESVTYNGVSGQETGGQINDPWSKRTATQHKSYAETEAYFVRTGATHARTNITTVLPARDRVRSTATTYDDHGMAVAVEDRGDNAVAGDEKCTRTWYARNVANGINSLVSRVRVTAKPCGTSEEQLNLPATSDTPGDVISDTATAYDSTTWSAVQTPTRGEPRWTGRAKAYGLDDQPVWQKVSTTTYDMLGRPLTVRDALDNLTASTQYEPAAAGPLTSTVVQNAALHTSTTELDFATGAAVKVTDPNGKVTESVYDSLGRVTQVWLPDRDRSLGKSPNYTYAYHVSASDESWVSTSTLRPDGGGYGTTYEIFDSLLRPRQTQTPSPRGGRLIALTQYDHRGLAVSSQSDIWDETTAPAGRLVATDGGQAPMQVDTTYDGAGRAVKADTKVRNVLRWSVETQYTGDTVTSTAPAGGKATAVVTNALGQTTQRREYGGTQPSGTDYTTTNYTYTPAGQQATVEGPDKAQWSYTYDLFGRQVTAADPDKGTSRTDYNELDQAISVKDSRQRELLTAYDKLGRKTGLWDGEQTDAKKLAGWTYDVLAKGRLDTAVRYENGVGQTTSKAYTQKVVAYDPLYRATRSQLLLPTSDPLVQAGVPSTLESSVYYNVSGVPSTQTSPAVAGLPLEALSYKYGAVGQLLSFNGVTGYLQNATYTPEGDLQQLSLGKDIAGVAHNAYLTYTYEDGTRRLTGSDVTDTVHNYMLQSLKFRQDDAGNVMSIFDTSTQGGTAKPDHQCFAYDAHRRMTEAWTPRTADCSATGRTTANLDGPAPYWTSYAYNSSGQRASETEHTATGDRTTTYTYGTTRGQPHPLAKTEGTRPATYVYDEAGNTTSRPGTQAQQTLTWNAEGKLTGTSEPAVTGKPALGTTYLYDASGELLVRRATGDGDTVLYFGNTEIRLTTKGTTKTLSGTRYYTAGGKTIAVRTGTAGSTTTKLNFLASDHHGTSSLVLDATTMAVTRRYTTPFGAPRGTQPTTWPDDKAFLGKPADKVTGLTHIGAREYDPSIAQFISVDPLLELDKHQTLNGYSYGAQNPATFSDPSGLGLACGKGFDEGCGSGVVTHGDGSLSKGGNPTGGGVAPGYGRTSGTSSADSSGIVIVLAEVLDEAPQKYLHQAPNGVCIYAVAGTCEPPAGEPVSIQIDDLPCPSGDPQWVCGARNALYKFGVASGMTGGSLGFFGLRSAARFNQARGVPEGFTPTQMNQIRAVFQGRLDIESNIVVQGSRVTGNIHSKSDVDIAVRVTPATFDALIAKRWPKPPNPGSNNADTREHAIKTGKITAGDVRPKLSPFRKDVVTILGDTVDHVDVSVIRMGGPFDRGPFIDIANN
ncbi:RHS repeat-associated core domain-containing protein [Streptomyces coeruleoprunus]